MKCLAADHGSNKGVRSRKRGGGATRMKLEREEPRVDFLQGAGF
jgi:hypothetical protein